MADLLIRNVAPDTIAGATAEAQRLGLSRNEWLNRTFDAIVQAARPRIAVTREDLRQAAAGLADDPSDPEIRAAAWR